MPDQEPQPINQEELGVTPIDIPKDKRGRVNWKALMREGEKIHPQINTLIETVAARFLRENGSISQNLLNEAGFGWLLNGISRYYPGRLEGLKEKFDLTSRNPSGYWADQSHIEEAINAAVKAGLPLKTSDLYQAGMGDLVNAINRHYPGGMTGVQERFIGSSLRKPNDYWSSSSNIESEAQKAMVDGIPLNKTALEQAGLSSLSQAIQKKYPGGIRALREKFGLENSKRPNNFWQDRAIIESEARRIANLGIPLTQKALFDAGLGAFSKGITKYYPGGMRGLKESLGMESIIKPMRYWHDHTNIEEEARKLLEKGILLQQKELHKVGAFSLAYAISKYYPGGLLGLREKLDAHQQDKNIPLEEANSDLDRLFGE